MFVQDVLNVSRLLLNYKRFIIQGNLEKKNMYNSRERLLVQKYMEDH